MSPPTEARERRHAGVLCDLVDLWRRATLARDYADANLVLSLIAQSARLSTYAGARAPFEQYANEQLGEAAAIFWRDLVCDGGLPRVSTASAGPSPLGGP